MSEDKWRSEYLKLLIKYIVIMNELRSKIDELDQLSKQRNMVKQQFKYWRP